MKPHIGNKVIIRMNLQFSPEFFLCNYCLNCRHNREDRSFLHFTICVQFINLTYLESSVISCIMSNFRHPLIVKPIWSTKQYNVILYYCINICQYNHNSTTGPHSAARAYHSLRSMKLTRSITAPWMGY